MWDKWVLLATLAGMTCLMRGSVGDIVATASGTKLTLALLAECAGVAAAEGFATPEAEMARYRGMLTQAGGAFTASMLRDIESAERPKATTFSGHCSSGRASGICRRRYWKWRRLISKRMQRDAAARPRLRRRQRVQVPARAHGKGVCVRACAPARRRCAAAKAIIAPLSVHRSCSG
jgi:hypothetical protein